MSHTDSAARFPGAQAPEVLAPRISRTPIQKNFDCRKELCRDSTAFAFLRQNLRECRDASDRMHSAGSVAGRSLLCSLQPARQVGRGRLRRKAHTRSENDRPPGMRLYLELRSVGYGNRPSGDVTGLIGDLGLEHVRSRAAQEHKCWSGGGTADNRRVAAR